MMRAPWTPYGAARGPFSALPEPTDARAEKLRLLHELQRRHAEVAARARALPLPKIQPPSSAVDARAVVADEDGSLLMQFEFETLFSDPARAARVCADEMHLWNPAFRPPGPHLDLGSKPGLELTSRARAARVLAILEAELDTVESVAVSPDGSSASMFLASTRLCIRVPWLARVPGLRRLQVAYEDRNQCLCLHVFERAPAGRLRVVITDVWPHAERGAPVGAAPSGFARHVAGEYARYAGLLHARSGSGSTASPPPPMVPASPPLASPAPSDDSSPRSPARRPSLSDEVAERLAGLAVEPDVPGILATAPPTSATAAPPPPSTPPAPPRHRPRPRALPRLGRRPLARRPLPLDALALWTFAEAPPRPSLPPPPPAPAAARRPAEGGLERGRDRPAVCRALPSRRAGGRGRGGGDAGAPPAGARHPAAERGAAAAGDGPSEPAPLPAAFGLVGVGHTSLPVHPAGPPPLGPPRPPQAPRHVRRRCPRRALGPAPLPAARPLPMPTAGPGAPLTSAILRSLAAGPGPPHDSLRPAGAPPTPPGSYSSPAPLVPMGGPLGPAPWPQG
eukprot:tig00020911_g15752.t1